MSRDYFQFDDDDIEWAAENPYSDPFVAARNAVKQAAPHVHTDACLEDIKKLHHRNEDTAPHVHTETCLRRRPSTNRDGCPTKNITTDTSDTDGTSEPLEHIPILPDIDDLPFVKDGEWIGHILHEDDDADDDDTLHLHDQLFMAVLQGHECQVEYFEERLALKRFKMFKAEPQCHEDSMSEQEVWELKKVAELTAAGAGLIDMRMRYGKDFCSTNKALAVFGKTLHQQKEKWQMDRLSECMDAGFTLEEIRTHFACSFSETKKLRSLYQKKLKHMADNKNKPPPKGSKKRFPACPPTYPTDDSKLTAAYAETRPPFEDKTKRTPKHNRTTMLPSRPLSTDLPPKKPRNTLGTEHASLLPTKQVLPILPSNTDLSQHMETSDR